MKFKTASSPMKAGDYLDGQFLVAMPGMTDPRFAKSVIYLCAHSSDGAMGLVVNRRARKITFQDLVEQLKLAEGEVARTATNSGIRVLKGGPVETQRGFVLHSPDYYVDSATLTVDEDVCLTATVDILRAIVEGNGPARAVLALGYAGWSPGQLENEIQSNGWLTCPADTDILFDEDIETKYARAFGKLGINPALFVGEAGHG